MTPSKTPAEGNVAAQGGKSSAVLSCLVTMTKRADFQRATRAAHVAKPGFVLQMRKRREDEPAPADTIRIGFTCSKKVGNAVARNRAKRRLREVARLALPYQGQSGHDYVLIGRKGATATLPFTQLQSDFANALHILHGTKA